MACASRPGATTLAIRRVYFTLHHILKELSSKRLLADQRCFADIAAGLLEPVWGQWCADTEAILTGLPEWLPRPAQARASAAAPPQRFALAAPRAMRKQPTSSLCCAHRRTPAAQQDKTPNDPQTPNPNARRPPRCCCTSSGG